MPTSPLSVCTQPGCPTRVPRGYCAVHSRTSTRNHRGVPRQARGYDRGYELARASLMGQPCSLRLPGCTGVADSADHYAGGLRPACQHCNYADGRARMGRAGQILGDGAAARTARLPRNQSVGSERSDPARVTRP